LFLQFVYFSLQKGISAYQSLIAILEVAYQHVYVIAFIVNSRQGGTFEFRGVFILDVWGKAGESFFKISKCIVLAVYLSLFLFIFTVAVPAGGEFQVGLLFVNRAQSLNNLALPFFLAAQ
jgi:hypothetical protein